MQHLVFRSASIDVTQKRKGYLSALSRQNMAVALSSSLRHRRFPPKKQEIAKWLLNDATQYLNDYPGRVFWPGLGISLTVLSINNMGDGMSDALDPRIRGR